MEKKKKLTDQEPNKKDEISKEDAKDIGEALEKEYDRQDENFTDEDSKDKRQSNRKDFGEGKNGNF